MEVLTDGMVKAQEALPFFITTLAANLSIDQYWLSYTDALVKLGQPNDAQNRFDQAKIKRPSGEAFDSLVSSLLHNISIHRILPQVSCSLSSPSKMLVRCSKLYLIQQTR